MLRSIREQHPDCYTLTSTVTRLERETDEEVDKNSLTIVVATLLLMKIGIQQLARQQLN